MDAVGLPVGCLAVVVVMLTAVVEGFEGELVEVVVELGSGTRSAITVMPVTRPNATAEATKDGAREAFHHRGSSLGVAA